MVRIKVLKAGTENHNKIDLLNDFLEKNNMEIHQTINNNGILYKVNDKFYKWNIEEDQHSETLPPMIDGRLIECDEWGNTDYYN
jgi:phage pi2 protein 07